MIIWTLRPANSQSAQCGLEKVSIAMAGPAYNPAAGALAPQEAEAALRETEAHFQTIFESALDGILIMDNERRFLDANPAACELLARPKKTLVGSKIEVLVDEVHRADFEHLWQELLRQGDQRGEFKYRLPSGGHRSFDYVARANFLPGRHLAVLRDITDRKLSEEALRESNERFRLLVENVKDYAIFMLDAAGRIISWNAGAERIKGYRPEEILGKDHSVFYPPEELERGKPQWMLAEAASKGRVEVEGWRIRKDGSQFWANVVITALKDEAGSLRGFAKVTRDSTERKLALEALREGEQRLHSILDSSPSIIFIKDTRGRYVYVNPQFQKLCNLPAHRIAGKSDHEIFSPSQAEAFRSNDLKVLQAGAPMEFEEVARHDDGPHTSVVNKFPLRDTRGAVYAICGIVTDITAHKRAEATIKSLLEVSEKLNSTLNVDELMEILVSGAMKLVDAEGGLAGLRLPQGMVCRKCLPTADAVPLDYCWPPGHGLPGWLIQHKIPYLTNDAFHDPLVVSDSLDHRAIRSALSIPILDARGDAIGFFEMHNKKDSRGFAASDQEHLMAVSQTASVAIQNALAYRRLAEMTDKLAVEKLYLENELHSQFGNQELVGQSAALKGIWKQIETVAPTDATVLILGETGTGKEIVARAIHNLSPRQEHTFVKLNCAAIPTGLLESELFGHEKGAFTGALSRKIGRLELAHRGTLFLDEVGDIPPELQPKLLRALQEKEFERLGDTRTIPVDLRLIAATNRDLGRMVHDRQFRSDLYYRLNVFPVFVPPLRARPEDIPLLTRHFVAKSARRMNKRIETIPSHAVDALSRWHWPGNVRELENFIERAVILTEGPTLQAPLAELKSPGEPAHPTPASLQDAEREHILRALRECSGVIAGPRGAAARLRLKRTTLNSKMRKLNITRRDI
jgi:formate hydrogenlyase transcriptional activator